MPGAARGAMVAATASPVAEHLVMTPRSQRAAALDPELLWLLAVPVWIGAYASLVPLADLLFGLTPLMRDTHLGEAVWFFLYDVPKVLLLLTGVVFVMGILRSFFSPERTRALLAGRREGVGNVAAAGLGIVTPFCSCSAVPLFIGFVSAGVPLGVTFSFLVAAPMVNEVALGLLLALFGWKIAALYLVLGLSVAIGAGVVLGRLRPERWVEPWVLAQRAAPDLEEEALAWPARIRLGRDAVVEIVGKVWPWIVAGIAVGAGIHGYMPEDLLASFMGREAWWSVPLAVLLGVPMYSNAAGVIPVVEALLGKGAALGTVLAFMMSVVALSLPEVLILRRVLRPQLIAAFVGVVATGILLVGYVFNLVL
jgi:uncharacterized membrane protein YraQ (UPF0718 family)